jgi:hypothetical protein
MMEDRGLKRLAYAVLLAGPILFLLWTGSADEPLAWVGTLFVFLVGVRIFTKSLPRPE